MKIKLRKISASILLGTMLLYTLPVSAFTKEETVYSNTKSDGTKYNSIVSTHLKNTEEEEVLKDLTDLLNIENTNGDETYKLENNNTLIWDANKKDIYYKGQTDKKLPIELEISYKLDGEDIDTNEIAGKSGKVEITINFINNEQVQKWVNDKYETFYTPFIVATGTYINNENNKNIEIVNGKLIDDGSKTFAIGLTFPGMQDSLNISKDKFEVPDKITIKMETENFEMNNIINYVTPFSFDDLDMDMFKNLNSIYSQVDKLNNASKQIENGAKSLSDGTAQYYEKSMEFNNAVGQFSAGVSTASSSYSELNAGIKAIDTGTKQLQSGSKQLSDGTTALNNGVNTMKNKVNSSAGKVPELVNGANQLYSGLNLLYNGILDAANNDNSEVTNTLTALVTEEKTQSGTLFAYNQSLANAKSQLAKIDTQDMDEETVKAIQTAIGTIDAQINANNSISAKLNINADNYVYLVKEIGDSSKTQLSGLAENVGKLKDGAKQISDGTNVVQSSMKELTGGLDTLSNSTQIISNGANNLYNGTVQLSDGASKAQAGSAKMQAGLQTLDSSAKAILNADNQLTQGAKTIHDGAEELSSGIQEFNESGVSKICDYINSDVRNVTDRIMILKDLAQEYDTFTQSDVDNECSVKFITIVDAIKVEKSDESGQEKIDEKPSN